MTRTANEAIEWMRNQRDHPTQSWSNLCLSDVRQSLDLPSYYQSAAAAWNGAHTKHRVSSGIHCPRGTAVFWTGGSSGYGHVVLSVGGGLCFSNDIKRSGRIDLASIDGITSAWGQSFQGWTEDLNGVHYYGGGDAQWATGDVYVDKLHHHQADSDSVRRLQARLLAHDDVPAKDVKVTGRYDDGTKSAVSHWQRVVADVTTGERDGSSVNNNQAHRLFGDKFTVHESTPAGGKGHRK